MLFQKITVFVLFSAFVTKEVVAIPSNAFRIPNGDRVPCPVSAPFGCSDGVREGQPPSVCRGLGHKTCNGGDFPLNQFGADFRKHDYDWKKICNLDSDGDGLSNGEELGDPCCTFDKSEFETWQSSPGVEFSHPGMKEDTTSNYIAKDECPPVNVSATSKVSSEDMFFLEGEDRYSMEFYIKNHSLSDGRTQYVDFYFDFNHPACKNTTCYVTGMEAIVDQKINLHHYVLYGCKYSPKDAWSETGWEDGKKRPSSPGRRGSWGGGRLLQDNGAMWQRCENLLAGWAPGKSPMFKAHPEAGRPLAANNGDPVRGFRINVHYSNDAETKGIVDASGFKIYFTTKPRKNTMSAFAPMIISVDTSIRIPENRPRHFITTGCFVAGLEKPIKLLDIGFHAHLLGREMYTEVYRNSLSDRQMIWEERKWYFDDQFDHPIGSRNIEIRNGDYVQATCVYNSVGRTKSTMMGPETTDEMCWSRMSYYPKQNGLRCHGTTWMGDMEPDELGRDILKNHPVPLKAFDSFYQAGSEGNGIGANSFGNYHACFPEDIEDEAKKSSGLSLFIGMSAACSDGLITDQCLRYAHSILACSCENIKGRDKLSEEARESIDEASELLMESFGKYMGGAERCKPHQDWLVKHSIQNTDCSEEGPCGHCRPCLNCLSDELEECVDEKKPCRFCWRTCRTCLKKWDDPLYEEEIENTDDESTTKPGIGDGEDENLFLNVGLPIIGGLAILFVLGGFVVLNIRKSRKQHRSSSRRSSKDENKEEVAALSLA